MIQMANLVKKLISSNNQLRSENTDQKQNNQQFESQITELQFENVKLREQLNSTNGGGFTGGSQQVSKNNVYYPP